MSASAAALFLAVGCEDHEPRVYLAPKEARVEQAAAPVAPPVSSGRTDAQWSLPEGWQRVADAPNGMRYATFRVGPAGSGVDGKDLEVTVVALGADASDVLPNINRWRGQLGLKPISAAELSKKMSEVKGKEIQQIQLNGSVATLIDIAGDPAATPPQRMLTAMIPHGDRTWFIKLQGPEAVVENEKMKFAQFVYTTKFVEAAPNETASTTQPSAPSQTQSVPPTRVLSAWAVPASWEADAASAGSMRLASFHVGAGEALADISLTTLQGSGGGALPNINRWRGQVGLTPVADVKEQELTTIDADHTTGVYADIQGPSSQPPAKQRMLIVLLVHDNQSFFIKMMGPSKTIAEQKPAFEAFVRSLRFAHEQEGAAGG